MNGTRAGPPGGVAVADRLAEWVAATTGCAGPLELTRLTGGNSNETCLLRHRDGAYVLRRPPRHVLSASAHNLAREHRVLAALETAGASTPRPVGLCEDPAVPGAPFLLMEHIDESCALTDTLPPAWAGAAGAITAVADEIVDALAAVHRVDWRAAGLDGFGRPEGFLARQVPRWYGQWQSIRCRPLPEMDPLAEWLEGRHSDASASADGPVTGIVHGDFHLDNCLFSAAEPRLRAVVDWEMATVGDPLLDLGLLLAFWGERVIAAPGMARIQAVSRLTGAPPREHLLARYEDRVGRRVPDVDYYRVLALFKLAAIVEAAYAQHRAGRLDTAYAAALEHDVPALLAEATAVAFG